MTKRKPVDENGNTIRKKRQAFGAPKDAATKAKSKHNETQSSFAKLPREVRRRIWRYVLGDEVLHIHRHWQPYEQVNPQRAELNEPLEMVVCNDSRTPSQLYELSKTSENYPLPTCVNAENTTNTSHIDNDSETCRAERSLVFCHDVCIVTKCMAAQWSQNLRILRTCRMIYHEANHVLWTTNTFSFRKPDDFSTFLKQRTTLQTQLITKLHFVLVIEYNPYELRKWQSKVSYTVIKKLESIREAHFCFSEAFFYWYGKDDFKRILKNELAQFTRNFRMHAPLRATTVIMDNRFDSKEKQKLSHTQRLEIAEELRNGLLDPEGAAEWQADHDAELADLTRMKERAKEIKAAKDEMKRTGRICSFTNREECARHRQERQDAKDAREGRRRKNPFIAESCICLHRGDGEPLQAAAVSSFN